MDSRNSLSCRQLRGVGERVAQRLQRMGILTIPDLLFHLPLRYEDRTRVFRLRDLQPSQSGVIEVVIDHVSVPPSGRTRLQVMAKDDSGCICLRFFHVYPKQKQLLTPGVRLRCFGEMRLGTNGPEMIHPEYHLAGERLLPADNVLTPVYPATEGISQSLLRKLMTEALPRARQAGWLEDLLPEGVLQELRFPSLVDALQFVHFPPAGTDTGVLARFEHAAQRRLIFEELLAQRLGLLEVRKSFQVLKARPFVAPSRLTEAFLQQLPWPLTRAQATVWQQISQDVALAKPMLRLVQGDVGCGKTVVAALALLKAVENGVQGAVLAPTELLVGQHFRTFQRWFEPLGVRMAMLSSDLKTAARREVLAGAASGEISIVVGTHAIFQKEVAFASLSLLVVDEQHRFGVQQRLLLREKGVFANLCPHQLVLTATPIPRTLAMSVYADLDYSVIDELPPGRLPVVTRLMPGEKRAEIFARLKELCFAGQQAYWVCTRIEESEADGFSAVEATFAEMTAALPMLRIGSVHGRMKAEEKERVMAAFREGQLHILVATTVIEVGVDVPMATVMVIENAERLGLAQLHQLRGRVGRGTHGGFCLLLYHHPLSSFAKERLKVMRETDDGFRIAQRDLELRGPGEVLGVRQTGEVSLRIADLLRDGDLLPMVQQVAEQLPASAPERVTRLMQRWVGSREGYGYV